MDWDKLIQPDGEETVVRRFIASYDSDGECGHRIYEGEPAGYIDKDDEPTCGDCLP